MSSHCRAGDNRTIKRTNPLMLRCETLHAYELPP